MRSSNVSAAYLRHADDVRRNGGQLAAYESTGHCVVLAGPGSGKTRTLTMKLARMLREDVRPPSGIACITYSNECVRELERRLERLGCRDAPNLYLGTVHGFCFRHLVTPFARLAGMSLPSPLAIATSRERTAAFDRAALHVLGAGYVPFTMLDVNRYRRVHLDRKAEDWQSEPTLARLSETYEAELRQRGVLDFEDLVLIGHALVARHDWVLRALRAKFPILLVDEYQDLGVPLHRIVLRLAGEGQIRLFAVGDPDQSVYGFTGADGALLSGLAPHLGVEPVRLRLNYRSAGEIIRASEITLGEARGYQAHDASREATIRFHECPQGFTEQVDRIAREIIPAAVAGRKGRRPGDIAILYRTAYLGTAVAEALDREGYGYIRVDSSASYGRCELTSWIEDCAAWCAGGWRSAHPALAGLTDRWISLCRMPRRSAGARREAARLTGFLWARRAAGKPAGEFVEDLQRSFHGTLLRDEPSLTDQLEQADRMSTALAPSGEMADLDIEALGTRDGSPTRFNLLTLHSAKGTEYDVVIMPGLDLGSFPWNDEKPAQARESRRLFYVGLTRAREEVHLLYSGWILTRRGRWELGPSPFITELMERLATEGNDTAAE